MPSRMRVVVAATAVRKTRGSSQWPSGPCRLPATCGAADRGIRVGVEVLAEHQVIRHDDAIHADGVHHARHLERCIPVLVRIVAVCAQEQGDLRATRHGSLRPAGRGEAGHPTKDPRSPPRHHLNGTV